VRRNIAMRGVQTDTFCPVCCRLDEDCGHLFFGCKRVNEVWRELGMDHVRDMLQLCGSCKEVIEKIWTLQEKEQQKIWIFLWRWWSPRNRQWEENGQSEICSSISSHLLEFDKLKKEVKRKKLRDKET
jgi:hypothetical protein